MGKIKSDTEQITTALSAMRPTQGTVIHQDENGNQTTKTVNPVAPTTTIAPVKTPRPFTD